MNLDTFIKQHSIKGYDPVQLNPPAGVDFICPDGARYSSGDGGRGVCTMWDPPTHPTERLQAQAQYFGVVLVIAQRECNARKAEFDEMDKNHLRWPSTCCPAPEWANAELRQRAANIAKVQEQLAAVQKQLDATPEAAAKRAQQKTIDAHQHEVHQRMMARANITM